MMKKLLSIWLLIMLTAKITNGQEQFSLRQRADKMYERYEYFKAVNLYLELAHKNNPPVQLLERIADCYLNINQYSDAEMWYSKAIAEPKSDKTDHYFYAEVLLRDRKFDLAKEQYKIYYDHDPESLAFKVSECDSAALWIKYPTMYTVENKKGFNTPFSDWGLNYDGKSGFIFTSDRLTGDAIDNRTGNSWFKMYRYDIKTNAVNSLTITSAISNNFNSKYHIGPMVLTKTADTAYITITTEIPKSKLDADIKNLSTKQKLYSRRLLIVIAVKRNNQWVITGNFPYNNIRQYSVSCAALSNNGNLIYFSSDMPGGEGKTDLWYCEKQPNGKWGQPVNCGKTINTPYEDDFPYLDSLGTLYYASKGLPGMGGYDIYLAKGEKSDWSEPLDLKYPINSTSDDFYLITRDGLNGYLSSNREGGAGSDDIYKFSHLPVIIPPKPAPDSTTATASMPPQEGFAFEPIYYDLDKSAIRPDAAAMLDKLVGFMIQYPQLKIQVSSFTDSRASGDYNEALSQRRATAAIDYLIAKGVDPNRLTGKWFGETDLVNNCAPGVQCTEAQHQLNRRTEFTVIK